MLPVKRRDSMLHCKHAAIAAPAHGRAACMSRRPGKRRFLPGFPRFRREPAVRRARIATIPGRDRLHTYSSVSCRSGHVVAVGAVE